MHLWGFESLADMEQRRASRDADAEWGTYLRESDGLIKCQENTVLKRAPVTFNQDDAYCDDLTVVYITAMTVKRGRMKELVAAYEQSLLPLLNAHQVRIAGVYISEVGGLNQFIQITAHKNYGAIESLNQTLSATTEWRAFRDQVDGLIMAQTTKIAQKVRMS